MHEYFACLKFLNRFTNTWSLRCSHKLPHEQNSATSFLNIPNKAERLGAARKAIEITIKSLKKRVPVDQQQNDQVNSSNAYGDSDDDDDDKSDDDNNSNIGRKYVAFIKDLIENAPHFINSLDDCPMILGFHAISPHVDADKCCFCPCSKKLEPWRNHHNISIRLCGDKKSFTPNGLVAHLEKSIEADVPGYHSMALEYLKALYENYWGVGIYHKGMYKVGDDKYRNAVAAERKLEIAYVPALRIPHYFMIDFVGCFIFYI